jgi:hypothetical protein
MKSRRKIIPITALAVTLSALAPASAPASSLLSGYGGPGQGTQAILGSTLLNGPSGGGGGSTGGGYTAPLVGAAGSSRGGPSSGNGRHTGARPANRTARTITGTSSASGPGGYSRLAASQTAAGGSGVFGLSYSALLFGLLAFAGLLFAGVFARGLARASGTRWHAGS